jgi:hypothetical protein
LEEGTTVRYWTTGIINVVQDYACKRNPTSAPKGTTSIINVVRDYVFKRNSTPTPDGDCTD